MTAPTTPESRAGGFAVNPVWTRLVAAVLAVVALAWAGWRATARVSDRRAEISRAEATLADFARLRERYTPAVAAESIAWRRTWMSLQELGVAGDERLSLTRSLTASAEAVGLDDVRVSLGPPDTTGVEARLSTEGIARRPTEFTLIVEGRGGVRPLIAFLGRLPPSVAVTQVTLARAADGGRARITLAVFELEYPNGQPPTTLWSPAQRSHADGGDFGRPRG